MFFLILPSGLPVMQLNTCLWKESSIIAHAKPMARCQWFQGRAASLTSIATAVNIVWFHMGFIQFFLDPCQNKISMSREILKNNPFYHVVSLSWQQWAMTIVLGVFLVPLRVALLSLLLTFAWLPYCSIFLPLVGYKFKVTYYEKQYVLFIFWAISKIFGIHRIYEGK